MSLLTRYICLAAAFVVLTVVPVSSSSQEAAPSDVAPKIEDLGDERYRIGNVIVDKAGQSFTLEGRILHLTKPLEYVAVKTGGYKAYESLLELDTVAVDFQLACILVGLDDKKSVKPEFQFDEREAEGQAVEITISWTEDGDVRTVSASEALMAGDEPFDSHDWVYIGSKPSPQDGSLLAESTGTLIGFVHDPFAVIEHRQGARAGSYGFMTGNSKLLPREGAPISLTVTVIPE